jgi:hypothetical protein
MQTKVPSVAAQTYGGSGNLEPRHVVTDLVAAPPQKIFVATVCLSRRQTSSQSRAAAASGPIRTPGAPQAQHQRAYRGQRMAVDGAQINRPAGPAARTEVV